MKRKARKTEGCGIPSGESENRGQVGILPELDYNVESGLKKYFGDDFEWPGLDEKAAAAFMREEAGFLHQDKAFVYAVNVLAGFPPAVRHLFQARYHLARAHDLDGKR